LELTGCVFPRLILAWPSLQIYSEITNEHYSLPKVITLTWRQAWFLRRTLRLPYWVVFVAKTNSGLSMLPLPTRRSAPSYGHINHALSMSTLKENASVPGLYPSLTEKNQHGINRSYVHHYSVFGLMFAVCCKYRVDVAD